MNTILYNEHSPEDMKIADLYLASGLLSTGYKLKKLDHTNPKRIEFVFSNNIGIQEDIRRYWNGELLGDLRSAFEAQKALKSQLYSIHN